MSPLEFGQQGHPNEQICTEINEHWDFNLHSAFWNTTGVLISSFVVLWAVNKAEEHKGICLETQGRTCPVQALPNVNFKVSTSLVQA